MVVSDVRDFLEKLGYKVQVSGNHREHMALWREWYRGKVDSFHNYRVYNGVKEVKRTKKTLGMAKKSCEDWADLLMNEKVIISVDESFQESLNKCMKENNFLEQSNALIEKVFALGTGAFVEYRNTNNKTGCKIDYISADMIFPLRIENGMIVDVAFASELDKDIYYVNIHEKQGRRYRIENVIFNAKNGNFSLEELPQGTDRVVYSDVPLFQIIKPNIVNNSDMNEAMGLSVFANAIDEMMDVDEKFDSYFNEFQLGKKRIFLDPSAINVPIPTDGETTRPAFDPDDVAFYGLSGLGEDGKKIEQTDFDLRVSEHSQALQDALNLFGDKVGFGSSYYVFKEGKVYTNTTDIISSNSKMFRRLRKHELILDRALKELVGGILYIITEHEYTGEISIIFDDSIIEDKPAERKQYKEEVAAGLMGPVEYRMKVYGEDEETARKMIPVQVDVMP